jgi:hypothetical protein
MKKALAGPAKRPAKKKPERRAMIAATQRRLRALPGVASGGVKQATARVDRDVNRVMIRAWPPLARFARRAAGAGRRWARWVGRRLRPVGVVLLRAFSVAERRLLRASDIASRAATRASAALTPERAVCAVIVASGAFLIASQFVDYRGVEVGQPGYAGLPGATPPLVGVEAAGAAHAYLLAPVGAVAIALALAAGWTGRNRLGRVVFILGLVSLAVVLLVDRPAGLDVGSQASRFSGASAVLQSGYYAELAAAAGLMLAGLLLVLAPRAAARYHARPCRTRISLFARAASGLRRRRRRRASSRGRDARRGSRRRRGAASAPASPR